MGAFSYLVIGVVFVIAIVFGLIYGVPYLFAFFSENFGSFGIILAAIAVFIVGGIIVGKLVSH